MKSRPMATDDDESMTVASDTLPMRYLIGAAFEEDADKHDGYPTEGDADIV